MAKHHYLPQFYLQGFTDPDTPADQDPYVWVHRPGSGWDNRGPRNVAAESGYYMLTDDSGNETDELERMLSQVESVAAGLIRGKISSQTPLTSDERLEMSLFLATMHARLPGQHEHIGGFIAQIVRSTMAVQAQVATQDPSAWEAMKRRYETETGEKLPDDLDPKDLDPAHYRVSANPKVAMALSFSSVDLLARIIADKGWSFLMTQAPRYFITSDYPFGIYNPLTEGTFYGPPLPAPTTEITIPLTRTIALFAGSPLEEIRWIPVPEELVRQINVRTAIRASFLIAPKTTFPGSDKILAAGGAETSGTQEDERDSR